MSALKYNSEGIAARCPECGGALSNFSRRHQGQDLPALIREGSHLFRGSLFLRTLYLVVRCGGCGRGGLATIHDHGRAGEGVLEDFYPTTVETAPLPVGIPPGIVAEYREAELCASVRAWRAASALLRSVLEKVLRGNGYTKGSLADRIDQAAADRVITAARQRRAHEDIRVLGNDILHDEWREVAPEEYDAAHLYTQRILEDFYDERAEVEALLVAADRISAAPTTP
jgi:hypothetical protein